jgi:hypothetical protein
MHRLLAGDIRINTENFSCSIGPFPTPGTANEQAWELAKKTMSLIFWCHAVVDPWMDCWNTGKKVSLREWLPVPSGSTKGGKPPSFFYGISRQVFL